jgi:Multiubiquitin
MSNQIETIISSQSEALIELEDLEQASQENRAVRRAHNYKIRIDRIHYVVAVHDMSGRQILELAGKNPPERWQLWQYHGKHKHLVALDTVVNFCAPGIERFVTLPLDQTDGLV